MLSPELKAVSVVNEAVQDGVAEGGVSDNFVPMFDGDLAGDDGRGAIPFWGWCGKNNTLLSPHR